MSLSLVAPPEQENLLEHYDRLRAAGVIDAKGLDPDVLAQLSFEEFWALGSYLGAQNSEIRFAIGDWINWGEATFAEKYAAAMHATGLSLSTMRSWANVAANIARVRRRTPEVSWSKHEAIATLPAREQRKWLDRIFREGWTVEETRSARNAHDITQGAGDGDPDDPAARPLPLRDAARRVWIAAHRDGDEYRVPVEAMIGLARAMGEPV